MTDRPRLLVPVAHGTFVLGPALCTSESLIDALRVVKGRRIGLVWTENDGLDRLLRLPEGPSWLSDAAEAVRDGRSVPVRDLLGMSAWAREADQE